MGREETRTTGRLSIQVGNRDLDGLVLQLQRTFEITGTVKVPEGSSLAGARVMAESMETGLPFQPTLGGAVDPAGAWKIPGVSPGKYRIYLSSGARREPTSRLSWSRDRTSPRAPTSARRRAESRFNWVPRRPM